MAATFGVCAATVYRLVAEEPPAPRARAERDPGSATRPGGIRRCAPSDPKQPTEATSPRAGWLTRGQLAAELGYRSIFPVRKTERTKLHPIREARRSSRILGLPCVPRPSRCEATTTVPKRTDSTRSRSRATCAAVWPSFSTRRTALALNSSMNLRRARRFLCSSMDTIYCFGWCPPKRGRVTVSSGYRGTTFGHLDCSFTTSGAPMSE